MVVDLPHDFSIIQNRDPDSLSGASNGFFPGGLGHYEKSIFIPEDWEGKKIVLKIEGAYMNTKVHCNHHIVGHNPYGYTSFHCNLTPYLDYGQENKIQVTVNNTALPNSRWYTGSGLYRHVWLMVGESLHIPPWGVYVTSQEATSNTSTLLVKTRVENMDDFPQNITVHSTLLDDCDNELASQETNLEVPMNGESEASQNLVVSPVNLWDPDNPYLYTLKSELTKDGEVLDSTRTNIGIRTISVDAQKGFRLNNVPIKLKGACIHHDCGLLGAAAYDRAEERKIELLKKSGFNAVRCSHNPPSPAFLDACDRLGMMVIDEAFDCWRERKNFNDYNMYFEEWWQKDMASMILRDRNHPSVIMWSTGNEIVERNGRSQGYLYAKKLTDYVRKLDNTRLVTNGLCNINPDPTVNGLAANVTKDLEGFDFFGELSYKFVEPLDVVGYNYLLNRYGSDGKKYPERVICGTETFPIEVYDYWEATMKYSHVIGDFVWTGIDYFGESGLGRVNYEEDKSFLGQYPWHQAFCGDIDICGFKRPQSYYRDCVWGIDKAPYIAVYRPENHGKKANVSNWGWPDVVSSWTWHDYKGKPINIDIYSSGYQVELLLNGESIGRKAAGKANRYIASFETIYEPGKLEAIAYDENGIELSRSILNTAESPAAIRLTPDRRKLKRKFGDLSYITVELIDRKGNIVDDGDNNIHFTAYGVGSILAVGNSNPKSEEMYVGNQRKVYQGRAMVVIRTNGEMGQITLTASADGIPPANISLEVD